MSFCWRDFDPRLCTGQPDCTRRECSGDCYLCAPSKEFILVEDMVRKWICKTVEHNIKFSSCWTLMKLKLGMNVQHPTQVLLVDDLVSYGTPFHDKQLGPIVETNTSDTVY